jgi:hypothetical protein
VHSSHAQRPHANIDFSEALPPELLYRSYFSAPFIGAERRGFRAASDGRLSESMRLEKGRSIRFTQLYFRNQSVSRRLDCDARINAGKCFRAFSPLSKLVIVSVYLMTKANVLT